MMNCSAPLHVGLCASSWMAVAAQSTPQPPVSMLYRCDTCGCAVQFGLQPVGAIGFLRQVLSGTMPLPGAHCGRHGITVSGAWRSCMPQQRIERHVSLLEGSISGVSAGVHHSQQACTSAPRGIRQRRGGQGAASLATTTAPPAPRERTGRPLCWRSARASRRRGRTWRARAPSTATLRRRSTMPASDTTRICLNSRAMFLACCSQCVHDVMPQIIAAHHCLANFAPVFSHDACLS